MPAVRGTGETEALRAPGFPERRGRDDGGARRGFVRGFRRTAVTSETKPAAGRRDACLLGQPQRAAFFAPT